MAQDKNPRRYTLTVTEVDPIPHAGLAGPVITLAFSGALSSRAKRELKEAIGAGNVELTEKRLA